MRVWERVFEDVHREAQEEVSGRGSGAGGGTAPAASIQGRKVCLRLWRRNGEDEQIPPQTRGVPQQKCASLAGTERYQGQGQRM